tara:strand:+ start:13058 stop:13294 length:237 start_codon:yes stop_codon:yes gene_type:complete
MPAKKTDFNFEKAIADLETIVTKMEDDELSLEQALKNFESGIKLTGDCQKALKDAEQKVQILMKKNGHEQLDDFIDDE